MEIDTEYWFFVVQLVVAGLLAMPTAINREIGSRTMGLRTFPLVSVGACAYILIALSFIPSPTGDPDALARVLQGLMSGIGFVGGGAILKSGDHVDGTASAASIWITGALGTAVGMQLWGLAVMLSVFNLLVVWIMTRLKKEVPSETDNGKDKDKG